MFTAKRMLIIGGLITATAFTGVAGTASAAGVDGQVAPRMTAVLPQACIDGGGTPIYPPNTYPFCKGGVYNGYIVAAPQ